jgi:hypothetical protein
MDIHRRIRESVDTRVEGLKWLQKELGNQEGKTPGERMADWCLNAGPGKDLAIWQGALREAKKRIRKSSAGSSRIG